MAHGKSPVTVDDVELIVEAKPLCIPAWANLAFIVLAVVGLVAFLVELFSGDAKHAWMALQVNYLYWLSVAAASTGFAAVFHICNAQWARPIKRIFESATPFFTMSFVGLPVLYFGHKYLFSWAHFHIPGQGKALWLSAWFVYPRDFVLLLLLIWVARKVVCLSVKRDILAIRGGLTKASKEAIDRWSHQRYDKLVGDSKDAKAEIEKATGLMGRFSPAVVAVYAVTMTFIAFDQIMSVDPIWYSTMFGGFYFMSGVYLAVAFASMGVAICCMTSPLFLKKIERRTLHDLGKLLFGFGIFWAYLFWSHYLPIWYGNLPEETGWIILRLREEPWRNIAWLVLGMSFITPFLLGLSRDIKQIPQLLFATGVIVAVGIWFQTYLLFAPTLYPKILPFGFVDFAVGIGFLGLYAKCAFSYLAKVPLMPFGDFYSK